jgi:hypothetical protein
LLKGGLFKLAPINKMKKNDCKNTTLSSGFIAVVIDNSIDMKIAFFDASVNK